MERKLSNFIHKKQYMKQILRTFMINEKTWEKFKTKCVKNNSDASKEIRKFINEYLKG